MAARCPPLCYTPAMFSLLLALIACVPDGADKPETAETAPPDDSAHDSESAGKDDFDSLWTNL